MLFETRNVDVVEGPPVMVVLRLDTTSANAEIFASAKPSTPGVWRVAQEPIPTPGLTWAINRGEAQIGIPLCPYNVADSAGLFAGIQFVREVQQKIPSELSVGRVIFVLGEDKRVNVRRCQWLGVAIWTAE